MRTTYLFFSLLLSLTAFGQPSPINRRAFALASLAVPVNPNPSNALPSGIFLWWVASDMPTNVVVSNQWADRVQGMLAQQGDPAIRPTNSNVGVYFNGSTYLTNVAIEIGRVNSVVVGWSVLMITRQDVQSGSQTVLFDNDSGTGGAYGIGYYSGNGSVLYWSHFNSVFRSLNYTHPLNYMNDIIICPTNTVTHMNCFTNGVATGVDWAQDEDGFFKLQAIGSGNFGANFFHGWIREIIIWTNGTTGGFNTVNISNMHYYSTNVYSTNVYGTYGIYP